MATFEQDALAKQVLQIIYNVRRDMRANAAEYLAALAKGVAPAQVARVAIQNTSHYDRILGWLREANANNAIKAKVQAGLVGVNMLYSDVVTYYQELRAACDAEQAAEVPGLNMTAGQIQAMANATIANVTQWDSIHP